jgi:hypothetical protein
MAQGTKLEMCDDPIQKLLCFPIYPCRMVLRTSFKYIFTNWKGLLYKAFSIFKGQFSFKSKAYNMQLQGIVDHQKKIWNVFVGMHGLMIDNASYKFWGYNKGLWMVICSKWFEVKMELDLTSWATKVIFCYCG